MSNDRYRLSNEDLEVVDMIATHYGYHGDSRAYAYLAGFSREILWAELDKLTR